MKECLRFLKLKQDAGADFAVTQLFFNNDNYFAFLDEAKSQGIMMPIIPGIMPIENFKQIEKITKMSGVKIPQHIVEIFNSNLSEEEKRENALGESIKQCSTLLKKDVPGLHFYTLNKSSATRQICKELDF